MWEPETGYRPPGRQEPRGPERLGGGQRVGSVCSQRGPARSGKRSGRRGPHPHPQPAAPLATALPRLQPYPGPQRDSDGAQTHYVETSLQGGPDPDLTPGPSATMATHH